MTAADHDRHDGDGLGRTLGKEACRDATTGDDEDAEPAVDGPRSPFSDLDAGCRVADRWRLGVAVRLDGLVHDFSCRTRFAI